MIQFIKGKQLSKLTKIYVSNKKINVKNDCWVKEIKRNNYDLKAFNMDY
jgi:hypothetical protein